MRTIHSEDGYTMVLFLAFIAAILLAAFSLYDNGTVATERIRMQNTSDATAYSTTNILARDMNFIAYTNRAMVANQVAIGQMVGLSSWIHNIEVTASNLAKLTTVAQPIPLVGQIINGIGKAIHFVAKGAKIGIDIGSKSGVLAADTTVIALSNAQKLFHGGTVILAESTFSDIAKANDKDIETGLLGDAFTVGAVLKSFGKNVKYNNSPNSFKANKEELANYTDFANIVNGSRDPFSHNRSYNWMDPSCFLYLCINSYIYLKASIQKKGGSDFIRKKNGKAVQWEWSAMDTVSLWTHLGYINWKLKKKKKNNEFFPIGWGAAHAINSKSKSQKNFFYSGYAKKKQPTYHLDGVYKASHKKTNQRQWGNGAWGNKMSATLAAVKDVGNNLYKTRGIEPFHTLKSKVKKDTGPGLVAMLTKKSSKLRVQKTIDDNSDEYNRSKTMQIEEQGGVAGGSLYGLSKAETYFARPRDLWPRKDQKREYGNLYNPFWQTRLIPNSANEQLLAAALQLNL